MEEKDFKALVKAGIDSACAKLDVKWQIESYSAAELDLKIDNPKDLARKDIEQAIINVLLTLPREQLPQNVHFHYD